MHFHCLGHPCPVGVKGLKKRPEKYLKRFGEDETSHSSFQDAGDYLVNVLYPTTKCTTFDQLRYELYMLKNGPMSELPPTSHSVRGHCYYIINQQINLLNLYHRRIYAEDFGWEIIVSSMLPEKRGLQMPNEYRITCGCLKGCTKRFLCFKSEVLSTEFCKCGNKQCGGYKQFKIQNVNFNAKISSDFFSNPIHILYHFVCILALNSNIQC